jgi:cyclopropane fatty-acyl-phospholipid synthase-like methyltransferase
VADSGPSGAPPRRGSARAVEEFEATYQAGTPAWDIGRPQPAFVRLADAGHLVGQVLDVGCGTGEHALMAAALGLRATGVDLAATAIAIATRKAEQRALAARFLTADALQLTGLGTFDTVLDCGLFHVLSDPDRSTFAASLRGCTAAGARYHMLCFSDLEPGDWGPRRIRQEEIRRCFTEGWQVETIEPSGIEITNEPGRVQAWLATIRRA